MKKTYLEMVKADVAQYLEDNEYYYNLADYQDADDFQETLADDLWICDSVTGNGSGSYTFNRKEAMEIVTDHMPEVMEALTELCYEADTIDKMFINEDYEGIDVITRCYFLHRAIYEVLEEADIERLIEEAKAEEAEEIEA